MKNAYIIESNIMDAVDNINGSIKRSEGNFLPFVLILDTIILN